MAPEKPPQPRTEPSEPAPLPSDRDAARDPRSEQPPILASWGQLYSVVLGFFVLLLVLFSWLSRVYR